MVKYTNDSVISFNGTHYRVFINSRKIYNSVNKHNNGINLNKIEADEIHKFAIKYTYDNYGIIVGDKVYVNLDWDLNRFSINKLYEVFAIIFNLLNNTIEISIIDDEGCSRLISFDSIQTIMKRRSNLINEILN